jgi:type I restriction enzyme, S subunit
MNIPLPVSLDGWRVAPITEVFDINCETLPSATAGDFEFDYLPLEIVSTERIDWSAVQRMKFRDAPSRARRCLKNGDLLIASVRPNLQGFAEFCAVGAGPFVGSTGFIVLSARDGHNSGFYLAQLLSDLGAAQFQAYVTGTNYPAISDRDFERIRVLVPGRLEEERAISVALNLLGEHITVTQGAIVAAERLQRALMRELFSGRIRPDGTTRTKRDWVSNEKLGTIPRGWKVEPLKNIATIQRGRFSHRPRNEPRFFGGSYPFIQTADIVEANGYIHRHSQTLNDEGLRISRLFPRGTIMITIAANIGHTAITSYDVCATDSVIGITPNSGVDPEFLEISLRLWKRRLEQVATESAQKNINYSNLRPLPIAIPNDENEQIAIASAIFDFERLIEAKRIKITALQRLKKSLMQNLLTGRMRLSPEAIAELTAESWL